MAVLRLHGEGSPLNQKRLRHREIETPHTNIHTQKEIDREREGIDREGRVELSTSNFRKPTLNQKRLRQRD